MFNDSFNYALVKNEQRFLKSFHNYINQISFLEIFKNVYMENWLQLDIFIQLLFPLQEILNLGKSAKENIKEY